MVLTDDLIRGVKASFVSRIVHIVTNGLLIVLLAGYLLTPNEYGLLFLILSIVAVAQLFADLGIARSAARYVSEFKETKPSQVPHILDVSMRYRNVLILMVCVALVLGRDVIAKVLGEPELTFLLLLGALFLAFQSLKVYHVTLFQGFNQVEYSAVVSIVDNLGRIALAVAFTLLGWGVAGALFGYIIGSVIAAALALGILSVRFYQRYEHADRPEEGLHRRIAEYSIPLAASRSANVVDKEVDIILVAFFLNPAAVAFYTLGKQISEFAEAPAGSVGFALSPAYGEEKANGRLDRASRIYETSLRYVLILYVPAVVGIVVVAEPAILLVFGQDYAPAVPVLQILSLFVLFKAINSITTQALDYLGRARHRAIVKGITSAANFGLNLVLIPTMGVVGAALATVLTFGLYSLANVFIMHLELSLNWRRILRIVTATSVISVVMGGCVVFLTAYISGILTLIGVVAIGVLVWAFLATVSGLLDVQKAASVLT